MDDATDTVLRVDRRELEALAEIEVTIAEQQRLDELLARSNSGAADSAELEELDRLLDRVDRLSLLKARAAVALQDTGESE